MRWLLIGLIALLLSCLLPSMRDLSSDIIIVHLEFILALSPNESHSTLLFAVIFSSFDVSTSMYMLSTTNWHSSLRTSSRDVRAKNNDEHSLSSSNWRSALSSFAVEVHRRDAGDLNPALSGASIFSEPCDDLYSLLYLSVRAWLIWNCFW